MGANGAGKTTTMDILSGCLGAHQGIVKVAGYDIFEQAKQAKARLGYLPDEPPLHLDMKVAEYLEYVARLRGVDSAKLKIRLQYVLETLSLSERKDQLIAHLSKGYRQRVGLAQALIHDPEVLILDEPTEGLDPNQIVQIRELIRSLKGEHTILFSSHILSEVESIADELVIIHEGRVVEQGSSHSLLSKSQSKDNFRPEVELEAESLASKLEELEGLRSVKLEAGTSRLTIQTDGRSSSNDSVLECIVRGRHGLLHFSKVSQSLEEIFTKLTH